MIRLISSLLAIFLITACQKVDFDGEIEEEGNVTLTFTATDSDITRSGIGDYFQKLNVMLFSADGSKAFDKVRTQIMSDENFGNMSMNLSPGTYIVVAVGHSSAKSATIKSPQDVRFTATDGEKLTDTFCYCGQIEVSEEPTCHSLVMHRATAMFRLELTDEDIPEGAVRMKFDYTGGSANFNPQTLEGITKSTQSENRIIEGKTYDIYTFPYFAKEGNIKVTVSALAADGTVIRQRVFENVEITRNRMTVYKGQFFTGSDGNMIQEGVGFSVESDWEGQDTFGF